MKKSLSLLLIILIIFVLYPVHANAMDNGHEIEYLGDGSYYVTIIEDASSEVIVPMSSKTVTKSKTTYYKNKNGVTLWHVKITGTFTYGDGKAKCTKATPAAASKSAAWKVSNISGNRSGNKASATATGKQYVGGSVVNTKTKTVTLSCSPSGVFS